MIAGQKTTGVDNNEESGVDSGKASQDASDPSILEGPTEAALRQRRTAESMTSSQDDEDSDDEDDDTTKNVVTKSIEDDDAAVTSKSAGRAAVTSKHACTFLECPRSYTNVYNMYRHVSS